MSAKKAPRLKFGRHPYTPEEAERVRKANHREWMREARAHRPNLQESDSPFFKGEDH